MYSCSRQRELRERVTTSTCIAIRFHDAGNPDEQICENLAAIQFVQHFVPAAGIEIVSD
jgi:hypothetical protein